MNAVTYLKPLRDITFCKGLMVDMKMKSYLDYTFKAFSQKQKEKVFGAPCKTLSESHSILQRPLEIQFFIRNIKRKSEKKTTTITTTTTEAAKLSENQ